jgi:putative nucleotidyltransferase with HDIG domain
MPGMRWGMRAGFSGGPLGACAMVGPSTRSIRPPTLTARPAASHTPTLLLIERDGPQTSRDDLAASVNVRRQAHTFGSMELSAWAKHTARRHLAAPLPRRWAHTKGVAARARSLAPILGEDADLLEAAAWLHDVGYAPDLARTGFHPLDGARYLRDMERADKVLCQLVAHHSCAIIEAEERGLAAELAREFEPARGDLTGALIYCDMTTSPDGGRLHVEQRLAEILVRYGPEHVVTRAISRSAPQLAATVARVACRLATRRPVPQWVFV